VHIPTVTVVTAMPETVHTDKVSDETVTARPDEAVAETPNGVLLNCLLAILPKEIV
jgi:hypothetical protein